MTAVQSQPAPERLTFMRTIVRRVVQPSPEDCAHLDREMKAFGRTTSMFIQGLMTKELRNSLVRRRDDGRFHKFFLRDKLVETLAAPVGRGLKSKKAFDAEYRRLIKNGEPQLAKLARRLYNGMGTTTRPMVVGKDGVRRRGKPVKKDVLQGRMWKLALEEAMQTASTYWATLAKAVKSRISKKTQWSDDQKHYARWLMTSNQPQFFVLLDGALDDDRLNPLKMQVPTFSEEVKDRKDIAKAVRRLLSDVRKQGRIKPPKASPTNHRMTFDCSCWRLMPEDGHGQTITVMGMVPAGNRRAQSRIPLSLKGNSLLRGTLEMMRINGEYVINVCEEVEAQVPEDGERFAVDLGLTEVAVDSDGKFYGDGLGKLIAERSKQMLEKGARRNQLHARRKRYAGSTKAKQQRKARNIERHNLGRKKQKKELARFKARVASLVNHACSRLFDNHPNCKELVLENLSHMIPHLSKEMNRRVTLWVRGYIVERLTYHAAKRGVTIVTVNASYTSRVCPCCGSFAKKNRSGDLFYCSNCDASEHADILAAMNLLARSYDDEISVGTPKAEVAKILASRFVAG